MSHDSAPGWIDRRVRAAVQGEMDALRQEIDSLRSEVEAERGARTVELSEARADLARLQSGVAEMRGVMAGLVTELRERAERGQAEFDALRDGLAALDQRIQDSFDERDARIEHDLVERDGRVIERDGWIEAVRTRLEGLMVQHRWDVEQLRQSLAVIAERLPLPD